MTDAMQIHQRLVTTLRDISLLDSIGNLLSWDEQTQMPVRGAALRADQAALIARLSHERFISPQIDEMIRALEGSELIRQPQSDAAVNARETRRAYDRARKLPTSLVEEMTRTAVLAQQAWVEARKNSHYATFQPWLEKTLDLKRQEAACVGYTGHPYNALLDPYEQGETAENLRQVFGTLRDPLIDLVGRITHAPHQAPVEILERHYPTDGQAKLARQAAEHIGFDFAAGRLDVSAHPFCSSIGPGDCRLTNRYDERYFADAFFGVLHEAGHGLYNQGLPPQHWGTPSGEYISLGIHESQSRLWENLVGRSRPFWRFFFPKVQATFPDALKGVTEDQWVFAVNDVRPSFIRTEADEATYNLHVLLRFELEQALLTNDLTPADVPGAWNEKMKHYLGLTPPDDARGCLQDIHWSHGAIGYFPTYTLGNLYAAQFFEQASQDLGNLDEHLARGDCAPLLSWLRDKIHRHGKRYTARQLVRNVTGKDLSAEPLLRHLNRKASELYGV